MALNLTRYSFNNTPLTIKNVIHYLYALNYHQIIPKFWLNFSDTEMHINIIYDYINFTKYNIYGYSTIIYNIETKKWKSIINTSTNINDRLNDSYKRFKDNYMYLIENNMIKVNYNHPYIEYVLESDYLEDILEPSFNEFNMRNIISNTIMDNFMKDIVRIQRLKDHIKNFYNKVNENENKLLFLLKKHIINTHNYLPNELWNNIYIYYHNTNQELITVPHEFN